MISQIMIVPHESPEAKIRGYGVDLSESKLGRPTPVEVRPGHFTYMYNVFIDIIKNNLRYPDLP